jgi:hypothetical protein
VPKPNGTRVACDHAHSYGVRLNNYSRSIVVVLSACLSLALLGLESAGPAQAASPKVPASRSGLRWASGVFLPNTRPSAHNAFGTWRGAKTDVAVTYSGRATWNDIVNPAWLYAEWGQAKQTVVISSAPYPDEPTPAHPTFTLAKCAAGAYDAHWKQFGVHVAKSGMAKRTIVRLAWEFNGDWNPWAAYKPADFVGCWQHVFRAAESTAPGLRWDWTVNRGVSAALTNPTDAWPGRKYVDIVGIDSYDGYPAVKNEASWQEQYAGVGGLKYWAAFAKRKGKRLSVPEWGLYPGTGWAGHGGGDNKFYIAKMFGFFRKQGARMAYEAYFNDDDPSQAGALKLNPRGAKEYRRQIKKSRARR